jgi:regulator of RNase E activity RraB
MNPTRHKKDLATLELQGFYKVDLGYEVNLKAKKNHQTTHKVCCLMATAKSILTTFLITAFNDRKT